MILYIHGFASSSHSNKVTLLKKSFQDVVAFDLSYVPELAMKQLEEFIELHKEENITLVGSSLGGFYAIYLANKYNLKVVLINPAIHPEKALTQCVDKSIKNYSTNENFYFKAEYIEQLKKLKTIAFNSSNTLLLLQTGDDVIDYTEAIAFLPQAKSVIESGGSHQFDKFENYFAMIRDFSLSR